VDGVALEGGTGEVDAVRGGLRDTVGLESRTPQHRQLVSWRLLGIQHELLGCRGRHDQQRGAYRARRAPVPPTELGDRNFDIPFSFGDHLGAGLRFGTEGEFDLGYRYQHLSNLSLGDSSPGMNFHVGRLGLHF
jgi:hypothetical protein